MRAVSGTGGGKLRPQGSPELCITEDHVFKPEEGDGDISWIKFRLKPCSDSNESSQIIRGFDPDDGFELHPKSDSSSCFTQNHNPSPNEQLWVCLVLIARGDDTSYWEVIDAEGEYANKPEPTKEPTEEPTDEPTKEPTEEATGEPTEEQTKEPTEEATGEPTE